MNVDPNKGLPAEITKLLNTLRGPEASRLKAPADAPVNNAVADTASFASMLKLDAETQKAQMAMSSIATTVSYNQVFDGVLLRLQKALERMLVLAELAQNPSLSAGQRAAYADEFAGLQKSLANIQGGESGDQRSGTGLSQQFHLLYGVPLEQGPRLLFEKLAEPNERRRLRLARQRRFVVLPRCSIFISCLETRANIEATLASALEQIYSDLECVVISNGPDRELSKRTAKFGERAVHVDVPRGSSFGEVFLRAIEGRSSPLFGWINCGDVLCPHSLQTVGSVFLKHAHVEWATGWSEAANRHDRAVLKNCDAPERATLNTGWFAGSFWRASLAERLAPVLRSSQFSEQALVELVSNSTPIYRMNLLLSESRRSSLIADSSHSRETAVPGSNPPQTVEVGAKDLYPLDPGQPLNALLTRIEAALHAKHWEEAIKLTRLAAAAEPDNPDIFGLEAVCEYQLGHIEAAGALLRNAAARFGTSA